MQSMKKDVDHRDKPGDDDRECREFLLLLARISLRFI